MGRITKGIMRKMKSIYSPEVLQRIIDQWGVGRIKDSTYFSNVGRNIWHHYIETTQGEFELYSYQVFEVGYARPKLQKFFEERYKNHALFPKKVVHSFDRYHVLQQVTIKQRISVKQAAQDLDLLVGFCIQKAFRVYGTIFQMPLEGLDLKRVGALVSYGWWSVQEYKNDKVHLVADSKMHAKDILDEAIEHIETDKPVIDAYELKGGEFRLSLSNGTRLSFRRTDMFPALEVHLNFRKNNLLIFEENELYYSKDYQGS